MLKKEIKEYIEQFHNLEDDSSGVFVLHMVEFLYARMVKKNNQFLAGFGLTFVQYNVLSLLYNNPGGINQLEISKRMFVSQANIARLVERMLKDGLIARRVWEEDRRNKLVILTPKGKNKFVKARSDFEDFAAKYYLQLKEIDTLKKLLAEWFFRMKED